METKSSAHEISNLPENSQRLCSDCQTGVLHRRQITYFTWLNDELITVPNFPAWICDICGRREYDSRAVLWLNTLLNPETGKRYPNRRRYHVDHSEHPHP